MSLAQSEPIEVNRTYSFCYPDFTQPGELLTHQIRVHWVHEWHDDWLIHGKSLTTGIEGAWYLSQMERVAPLVGQEAIIKTVHGA